MIIDLNCDLGEGYTSDLAILPLITSVNLACCRHAGSPDQVLELLFKAKDLGINIGAHPGYNDPVNFGRNDSNLSTDQIFAECLFQVGALKTLADFAGVSLSHLKPHGALYHQASSNKSLADKIILIAQRFNLAIFGPPNSALEFSAQKKVPFFSEGFADRKYSNDGKLTPRTLADAFVTSPTLAGIQCQQLISNHNIKTLCVHGDQPGALTFIHDLRHNLKTLDIEIQCLKVRDIV